MKHDSITRLAPRPAKISSVKLEVFNPTGLIEVNQVHAPRLDDLHGKTICELSNNAWEADRTFPLIRRLLKERFPDATLIPYTEFPLGSVNIDTDKIGHLVKEKGGQAVITGNAA
jgi:hypothetical protein